MPYLCARKSVLYKFKSQIRRIHPQITQINKNSHRPTQTHTNFAAADLAAAKMSSLREIIKNKQQLKKPVKLSTLIIRSLLLFFMPEGLNVFPLPESAEEKVCVSLCGSVANF